MRILATLATAAVMAIAAAAPAAACSMTKQQLVQTPAPVEEQTAQTQTPVPGGALVTPTETAKADQPAPTVKTN
jgi:hypothetical protein